MKKSHYDEIEIRTTSDDDDLSVGIQILIDGTVYVDGDDYYLNVDSFFEALGQQSAVIQFVGGCHYPPCCANGAWTSLSQEAWCWNDSKIRLRWLDVKNVAESMLRIIDEHAAQNRNVWCVKSDRMEFYRTQLAVLEARVSTHL